MLPHAPGVQVQAIPEDGAVIEDSEAEEKINPDERLSQRDLDKRIQHENEYSDSEEEGDGGRRDNRSFKVCFILLLCKINNHYILYYHYIKMLFSKDFQKATKTRKGSGRYGK